MPGFMQSKIVPTPPENTRDASDLPLPAAEVLYRIADRAQEMHTDYVPQSWPRNAFGASRQSVAKLRVSGWLEEVAINGPALHLLVWPADNPEHKAKALADGVRRRSKRVSPSSS